MGGSARGTLRKSEQGVSRLGLLRLLLRLCVATPGQKVYTCALELGGMVRGELLSAGHGSDSPGFR